MFGGRVTSMSRFDETVPEPITVATCESCGREIYAGDEVYRVDDGGGYVHDDGGDCADEYAKARMYDRKGTIDKFGNVEQ